MDTEELENRIVTLSQRSFRSVVSVLLQKLFGFVAINVDGAGDSGSDWLMFSSGGQKIHVAVQDTIQRNWSDKALEDAKKVKAGLSANRFFFCTNRPHQQLTVTTLENDITAETGLSATVLDAEQLAKLIVEGDLVEDFLVAIGEGVSRHRPKMSEITLCTYTNLSADRTNHRNEIYSDTLIAVCREKQPISREKLVSGAMEFLGSAAGQRQMIDHRVDVLQSERKLIWSKEEQTLRLSPEITKRIDQTERLYLSDWNALTGAQTSLLNEFGGNWDQIQAEQATVFLARLFIREQLRGLQTAGAELLPAGWLDRQGDPKQQLRDLIQQCGVPSQKIGDVIGKLVGLARHREVITKLTRTAVFAALEGQNPLQSARALGASGWDEVNVLLDASVAIPLLCARRTEAVDSYRYSLSSNAVDTLQKLGAVINISPGHLEECASHLLRAFHYPSFKAEKDVLGALRESENVFVAYYYALRVEGRTCPETLQQFLQVFSEEAPSLLNRSGSWSDRVRRIMPDLQEAFGSYDVALQQMSRIARERVDVLDKAHDIALLNEKRSKPPILRRHDIAAMSHLEARSAAGESWIFLTWDRTLLRLAFDHMKKGWVASPEVAMDFAQPCRRLTDTQWCALSHRLARVSDPKETLTARIMDRVARLQHERLQDWQFIAEIRAFRDEAMSRIPVGEDARFHEWVDTEVKTFVRTYNVVASESADMDDMNAEIPPPEPEAKDAE